MFTPPAFVEESYTIGATFNVYTAGVDGVFSSVLSGVSAGTRDSSLEGLQTFGGVRALARYVKIEGVPGSGGEFSISKVCWNSLTNLFPPTPRYMKLTVVYEQRIAHREPHSTDSWFQQMSRCAKFNQTLCLHVSWDTTCTMLTLLRNGPIVAMCAAMCGLLRRKVTSISPRSPLVQTFCVQINTSRWTFA